jgi:hypothetical protein
MATFNPHANVGRYPPKREIFVVDIATDIFNEINEENVSTNSSHETKPRDRVNFAQESPRKRLKI